MNVLNCGEVGLEPLQRVLKPYGMVVEGVAAEEEIPGSFWGDEEAGLIENRLLVRDDTPLHSALHEACHYICMDQSRRQGLHTDAGGGYDEENGVCYLQVLLADRIAGFGRARMFADMDAWGYSFRLGSSQRWFEQDAVDANQWLADHNLLDAAGEPNGQLRQ
ncbi:hypothetical protein BOW53_03260 [Solemya pervernicosa gill symbiont]|uniref:IrrE N-terminal-like domain-containing protein n=2 Tax=Gammaproteobacteria incertae sedis TaxID=118884 RepID=A0A1T2L940_9GAMM|nr:hypothetical protein [Candidatus Reidiella endopervernicosa]OOZ41590.1 hypothetical protein BOW53_03260 [Solemya pervernicosa gill symbiont]QKQ27948.1 hypothetical protein HUE57_17910 [Candidatus Reidiella endopervernicosa]